MKYGIRLMPVLKNNSGSLAGLAAGLYFIVFAALAIFKYFHFGYNCLDLGIINQVFYNSAAGRYFAASIHPPTYLGDHFSPILILLLPVYLLAVSPLTLIIFQILALAAVCWPLYLLAKHELGPLPALAAVILWLANPFVQNATLFEFSFLPFAVLLVFWAMYYYQKNRYFAFLLFCFIALLVREDVAFVIFGLAALALMQKRSRRWWLVPAVFGAAYFLLALKITGSHSASGQYKFLLYYSWLGNTFPEIIAHALTQPWLVVIKLVNFGSIAIALTLLLPVVLLPLVAPAALLPSLFVYLQLVSGTTLDGLTVILYSHYCLLLLPGIYYAAIGGYKNISRLKKYQLTALIITEKGLAVILVAVTVIYIFYFFGPLPGSVAKLIPPTLELSGKQAEALSLLPPDAAVAASYAFLPALSGRENLFSLNYVYLGKQQFAYTDYRLPPQTEYLAVDFSDLVTYRLQYGSNALFQKYYEAGRLGWAETIRPFGVIYIYDTIAVLKKNAPNILPLTVISTSTPALDGAAADLDPTLKFLGYRQAADHFELFWQLKKPLLKTYQLRLNYQKDGRTYFKKIYPFGYDLLYGQNDLTEKKIQTNYWFGTPALPAGIYDLQLELIEIEKGGIEFNAWRGTDNIITQFAPIGPALPLGRITLP